MFKLQHNHNLHNLKSLQFLNKIAKHKCILLQNINNYINEKIYICFTDKAGLMLTNNEGNIWQYHIVLGRLNLKYNIKSLSSN